MIGVHQWMKIILNFIHAENITNFIICAQNIEKNIECAKIHFIYVMLK